MEVVSAIDVMKNTVLEWKQKGLRIGFVPTMGYLHEGHLSLIKRAREENDRVVVSVFVNPMQFAPTEDLDNYPRDLQADASLCKQLGVDILFHPTAEAMYPKGFSSFIDVEGPTEELCGKSRQTHFRGVCTVVAKLFHIIAPDQAYFGQKDAQQLAVLRKMVDDLQFPIKLVACPIVREADGLAKSSRNAYLSKEERKAALVLSQAIFAGKAMVLEGERNTAPVLAKIKSILAAEPLAKIDYVSAVDAASIKKVETFNGETLVAIAVYIGKTRLIDNFIVSV